LNGINQHPTSLLLNIYNVAFISPYIFIERLKRFNLSQDKFPHSLIQSLSIRATHMVRIGWVLFCVTEATVPGKHCQHLSRAMCCLNGRFVTHWFRLHKTQDSKGSRVIGFFEILRWHRKNNEVPLMKSRIVRTVDKTRFREYFYMYMKDRVR